MSSPNQEDTPNKVAGFKTADTERMKVLLEDPTLLQACFPAIKKESWVMDRDQWIHGKISDHYSLYKNYPTPEMLCSYANDEAKKENPPVHILPVMELLGELKTKPQDPANKDFFKTKILKESQDRYFHEKVYEATRTHDWGQLSEILSQWKSNLTALPPLQTIKQYIMQEKSHLNNLLNDWFFERGATIALVGGTGYGKSTLVIELLTHWAVGKPCLGFVPNGMPRILIFQNEDSDNDVAIQRNGATQNFTEEEHFLLEKGLRMVRLQSYVGDTFLSAVDIYCNQFQPDIICVNPILKYFDGDPINTKDVNKFLNKLDAILKKYHCGLIMVHHTTKQNDLTRKNPMDVAYAAFGSAAWSNAVRDTIVLGKTTTEGVYTLSVGKRADKLGWSNKYIYRSSDTTKPYWSEETDPNRIAKVKVKNTETKQSRDKEDAIWYLIPPLPGTTTIKELEMGGVGTAKTIAKHLKALLAENKIGMVEDDDRTLKYFRKSVLPLPTP